MAMKSVDAKTLKTWLDKQEALLIDVREPEEYKEDNIPGSALIPLQSLTRKALPELGTKKLVVHCKLGKRGEKACEQLMAEDASLDIYNLEGGIQAWIDQGNKVNKGT